MKSESLKRQKKSATENPATHVSGKYELLHELGQQELLTPDGNIPCESTAPCSCAESEGYSQRPKTKPNNWASKRKETRWEHSYSSRLEQPQRLLPPLHQHRLQPAHPQKPPVWLYSGLTLFY